MEPVSSNEEEQRNFEIFSRGYDAAIDDVISVLENSDSVCNDWAIALIRKELQ